MQKWFRMQKKRSMFQFPMWQWTHCSIMCPNQHFYSQNNGLCNSIYNNKKTIKEWLQGVKGWRSQGIIVLYVQLQFGVMRKFWKCIVVMVTPQRGCT